MAEICSGGADSALEGSPSQARTPGRDIFGKLDDHLPEVRIPFEVKQDAERVAREDGCGDLATWLRELVCGRLYGSDHVGSLYLARNRRVVGDAGSAQALVVRGDSHSHYPGFLRGGGK